MPHKAASLPDDMPHLGSLIEQYLDAHRIHERALARAISRYENSILDIKKKPSLHVSVLWQLSHALKHNFLKDIAALLPAEYGTDAPADTAKDARITALQEEVKALTTERDLLMKVLGKG